jgi:hypothetical protein
MSRRAFAVEMADVLCGRPRDAHQLGSEPGGQDTGLPPGSYHLVIDADKPGRREASQSKSPAKPLVNGPTT